jgi:hypothetical protein
MYDIYSSAEQWQSVFLFISGEMYFKDVRLRTPEVINQIIASTGGAGVYIE